MNNNAINNRAHSKYSRVVSLVPSLTKTLFDLGLGNSLVGVTKFCNQPKNARDKPRVIVGGTKNPNIQKIADLQPDLILMNVEENRIEDFYKLKDSFPIYGTKVTTINDNYKMLKNLIKLFELDITPIIAKYLRNVKLLKEIKDEPVWSVFCPIWKNPWMSISKHTYISSILFSVGLSNIVQTDKQYPEVSLEEVKKCIPNWVILPDEPYKFKEVDRDFLSRYLRLSPERCKLVDGSYLSWFGTKTALHPSTLKKAILDQPLVNPSQ